MAKLPKNRILEQQVELLDPEPAEIRGLCITNLKINDGQITATLSGVINVGDITTVSPQTWMKPISDWLFQLGDENQSVVLDYIYDSAQRARARAVEREAMRNEQSASNVVSIPSGYASSANNQ